MEELNTNFKAGYISILGLPNAGKSTLINRLIGEKISIVSPRKQTTRNVIHGIKTTEEYQAIFVDTPGFHTPKSALNKAIVNEVSSVIPTADVITLLVDYNENFGTDFMRLIEILKGTDQPKIALITKIDMTKENNLFKPVSILNELLRFEHIIPISTIKDINIDKYLELAVSELPNNYKLFDEDMVTTQSEQFLISEYVREQIFLNVRNEVPYDAYVRIETIETKRGKLTVSAIIYVQRESQKAILIGKNGEMMKKIGESARKSIEDFFGIQVNLKLWTSAKQNAFLDDEFLSLNK